MKDNQIISSVLDFGIRTIKGIYRGDVNLSINRGVLTLTWLSKTDPVSVHIKLSTIKKSALKLLGIEEEFVQKR